tara:strand:+ start:205 stop:876 length:672 start_codon:yes stop_codon:yes gene_type:complete
VTLKKKPKDEIAIKICGLTQLSQAKAIASMGVNAIGVIGVPSSPRFVSPFKREEIFSGLEVINNLERVLVVADFQDADFDLALKGKGSPTIIQLHGNESPQRCNYLREKYSDIKWWKALRIKNKESLSLINNYKDNIDALLIDAWSPTKIGGTGFRVPIDWLSEIKINLPWWIAGGISKEWIPKLLKNLKPYGIDASSKLEISPGIKDLEKVKFLINEVRNYK